MSYSACDFADDVATEFQMRKLLSKRDEARIDKAAARGEETTELCAELCIDALRELLDERDALKAALAEQRKARNMESTRLKRRLHSMREYAKDLFEWADGNTAYFGETADTRPLCRRAGRLGV